VSIQFFTEYLVRAEFFSELSGYFGQKASDHYRPGSGIDFEKVDLDDSGLQLTGDNA
jgi:hypothetical protein